MLCTLSGEEAAARTCTPGRGAGEPLIQYGARLLRPNGGACSGTLKRIRGPRTDLWYVTGSDMPAAPRLFTPRWMLRPSTALANRRRFRPSRQAQRRRHPTPSAGERGGSRAGRAGFRDAVPLSPPWPPEAPRPTGSASFLSLPSFLSVLATEEQRESGPAEHVPTELRTRARQGCRSDCLWTRRTSRRT